MLTNGKAPDANRSDLSDDERQHVAGPDAVHAAGRDALREAQAVRREHVRVLFFQFSCSLLIVAETPARQINMQGEGDT